MGVLARALLSTAIGISGCALLLDTEELSGGEASSSGDGGQPSSSQDSAGADPSPDAPAGTDDGGAGVPDAGLGSPRPPLPCPPTALLCDDFEGGNLARWSRTFSFETGEQSIDDQRVYSGERSLHAKVGDPANPTGVGVSFDLPTPLSTGTFAARAYVYSASMPKQWTDLMRLERGGTYTSMGVAAPNWRAYDWAVSQAFSGESFEPGAWLCVEWVVELGIPGRVRVYVDGNPVINTVRDTIPPEFAGWTGFRFGIVYNNGDEGADIHFDDVAIGTSRIGCR